MVPNQLLLLDASAKRRLELYLSKFCGWIGDLEDWIRLSSPLEAAGGIQHIHLSGEYKTG